MWSWLKGFFPAPFKRGIKRNFQNLRDSIRYRASSGRGGEGANHVVFICKGNICRSAFAEHYLKERVAPKSMRIESYGLDVDQGNVSPPEAVRVAREFGVDLGSHYSKKLSACDVEMADMIVPMEYRQYVRLMEIFPGQKGKIRLLREFAPWPDKAWCNIYDPFGLDEIEFRRCFKLMQKALDGLKVHLRFAEELGKER